MTRIKLELISDIDKHLFIEKGLGGRISYICKRFSEDNLKQEILQSLERKWKSFHNNVYQTKKKTVD